MAVRLPESGELGRVLEEARKKVGMSQHELWLAYAIRRGDEGHKSPNAIYQWLRGRVSPPPDHYNVLAEILNERLPDGEPKLPTWILGWNGNGSPSQMSYSMSVPAFA